MNACSRKQVLNPEHHMRSDRKKTIHVSEKTRIKSRNNAFEDTDCGEVKEKMLR